MPTRRDVFVNGGIYHIYSKSIDQKQIFKEKSMSDEFLGSINYYKISHSKLRYSKHIENLSKSNYIITQKNKKQRIEILSFCLMPNH